MAQLLLRCLNSDARPWTPLDVPTSLQGLFGSRAVDSKACRAEAMDTPLVTPRDVENQVPPAVVQKNEPVAANPDSQPCRSHTPTSPSADMVIATAGDVQQGSWMSGSTVLITPSMGLENPNFPRRTSPNAASTEISYSIQTPSLGGNPLQPFLNIYFGPEKNWSETRQQNTPASNAVSIEFAMTPSSPSANRVHTRQQSKEDIKQETRRGANVEKFKLGNLMLPRISDDPIACNKACYILHPDFPDAVVAEGRSCGSWKAKT